MKRIVLIVLCIASNLLAYDPPIEESAKLQHAVWAGSGSIVEISFVERQEDAFLWKATFSVMETIKGEPAELIEFFYEQGKGVERLGPQIFRCPPFPAVENGSSVRIFLHKRTVGGRESFFLNGSQMIQKIEPNKAMEPTPVNVTTPAYAGLAPSTSAAHL